jgi:hypothetical protein
MVRKHFFKSKVMFVYTFGSMGVQRRWRWCAIWTERGAAQPSHQTWSCILATLASCNAVLVVGIIMKNKRRFIVPLSSIVCHHGNGG